MLLVQKVRREVVVDFKQTPTVNTKPVATEEYVDNNLPSGVTIHVGATPPTDTNMLWLDTSH